MGQPLDQGTKNALMLTSRHCPNIEHSPADIAKEATAHINQI